MLFWWISPLRYNIAPRINLAGGPSDPSPGVGLGRTLVPPPVPASTPSHGMIPLKCLPIPSAGHERRVCPLHSTSQWISTYPPSLPPQAPQPHLNTGSGSNMNAGIVDPGPASSSIASPQVTPVIRGNASEALSFHHSNPQSGTVINSMTSNPNLSSTPVISANTAALPVTQAHLARCHLSPGATHQS